MSRPLPYIALNDLTLLLLKMQRPRWETLLRNRVNLDATHEKALEFATIDQLRGKAMD